MSEILAFIKTHRRDIIITAAALAASLVVMLLIPALIVGNAPSTAGMLACIALFFAVDPAFCLAAIFAGWDLRRRWFTALFPPLAFLISTGAVFGSEAGGFMFYFVIYLAICLIVTPVTHLVRKYGRSES